MNYKIPALMALLLALGACASDYGQTPSTVEVPPPQAPTATAPQPAPPAPPPTGTVSGAQGRVAGAHVGGAIGQQLDYKDRTLLQSATQKALENGGPGEAVKWRNNGTGAYGSVTPQPRFTMNNSTCREFQQDIFAGGEMATGYGTACRDGRGIWRIAENG